MGSLWLVVASCSQKMWRKVCVMATGHLTVTGYLGASRLGVAQVLAQPALVTSVRVAQSGVKAPTRPNRDHTGCASGMEPRHGDE